MLFEHWRPRIIRTAVISTGVLCAAFCGMNAAGADLLWYNDFENSFEEGATNSGWNRTFNPTVPDETWVDASTDVARAGQQSLKTYLAYSPGDNFRSEVTLKSVNKFEHATDYWLGFSIYVPKDWKPESAKWDDEVVMQFHTTNDPGDTSTSPTAAIKVKKEQWVATVKYATEAISKGSDAHRWSQSFGKVVPGTWNDFVANVRFGWQDSQKPHYKLWKDGELVVNYVGPTASNDKVGLYWILGMYNIGWRFNQPTNVTERTYYYDEIRIAGPDGTLEDVAPWVHSGSSGGGTVSAPTAPPAPPTLLQ